MNLQDKCEWIHSQIQEAQNGAPVDWEMMLALMEDVREYFFSGFNFNFEESSKWKH